MRMIWLSSQIKLDCVQFFSVCFLHYNFKNLSIIIDVTWVHVFTVHLLTIYTLMCYLYRLCLYGLDITYERGRILYKFTRTYFYSLTYDFPMQFIKHGTKLRQISLYLHLATPVFTSSWCSYEINQFFTACTVQTWSQMRAAMMMKKRNIHTK